MQFLRGILQEIKRRRDINHKLANLTDQGLLDRIMADIPIHPMEIEVKGGEQEPVRIPVRVLAV